MSTEQERFEKWIKNHRRCTSREIWQAAIQSERERCAKIADERAGVLFELAGKESIGPLMISLKTAAEELRHAADAIRRGGEHEHSV